MKKISVSLTLRPADGCGATVTVVRSRNGGAPYTVGITWRTECESPAERRPGSPGRPEGCERRGSRQPKKSAAAHASGTDEK